jgi:uncharacterized protein YbbK (DUF523 family)
MSRRPRVGISACLLGEPVRWDGGHKLSRTLIDTLADRVEWVTVCPEIEIGLGAPREPMNLVDQDGTIRLLGVESRDDQTTAMRRYARRRVEELAREELSGFVLKSRSPSCGREGVPVYDTRGAVVRSDRGFFAQALLERFPELPIEEEDRLADSRVRRAWLARVLAYDRRRR